MIEDDEGMLNFTSERKGGICRDRKCLEEQNKYKQHFVFMLLLPRLGFFYVFYHYVILCDKILFYFFYILAGC